MRARADKLGIPRIHEGVTDKRAALESILRDAEVAEHEVAYIGDDVNDSGAMRAIAPQPRRRPRGRRAGESASRTG